MERGIYIGLEGGEGAGKSLQNKYLAEWLKLNNEKRVVRVREPGGTPLGEKMRSALLQYPQGQETELLIFSAARSSLIDEVVKPSLEKGTWVLSDRTFYSTLAYQGYARGINFDFVNSANRISTKGIVPDTTFLIDVDPEVGLEKELVRWALFRDGMKEEEKIFHRKVREGYLEIAKQNPDKIVVIPYLAGKPEEMQKQIREEIKRRYF